MSVPFLLCYEGEKMDISFAYTVISGLMQIAVVVAATKIVFKLYSKERPMGNNQIAFLYEGKRIRIKFTWKSK